MMMMVYVVDTYVRVATCIVCNNSYMSECYSIISI